jgi:hypothetical protein
MPKPVVDFVDLFRQCSARTRIASPAWERDERGTGEWVTTIVYSQWFQDLVVQNLAAIETTMTAVATQEGENPVLRLQLGRMAPAYGATPPNLNSSRVAPGTRSTCNTRQG